MKIKYEFSNGENIEVEVPGELGEIILGMDKQERNTDRRETRRHTSLDGMEYEGEFFIDSNEDIAAITEQTIESDELHRAMDTLLPQQKMLINKVFFEGRSIASIAREEGVGESAIRDRLNRIIEKMKKVLI